MSSSDKPDATKSSPDWQPLVPSDLEKYDKENISEPDMDDPEIARAFNVLYERQISGTERKFSLLYGPRAELAAQDQEEEEEPEVAEEQETEPVAESEPVPEMPDVEAIEKQAYEEGFSKGEKDGYEAGIKAAEEKTERLSSIVRDAEGLWLRIVTTYEQEIIKLVGRVAEKVVYGRVAVDKEIITRAILDAFEQIPDPVTATITVHPDDYEYIEVVKEDFFEHIKGLKQVSIVSDPLINIGGCRIETASGEVDTSIEERLEAVRKSIIETAMKR